MSRPNTKFISSEKLDQVFNKEDLEYVNQPDQYGDYLIHRVAKLKDPKKLDLVINLMLEKDPKANLNPFVITSEITGSGYDVAVLLKESDVNEKKLKLPESLASSVAPEPSYCPKCEKVLKARIALQKLDLSNDEVIFPVLRKFSQEDYDFNKLTSQELTILSSSKNSELESFISSYKKEIDSKIAPSSIAVVHPQSIEKITSSSTSVSK